MRSLRLHGKGDVRLHEEDRPQPREGETLVRVTAVGLCGSDLRWFTEGGIGDTRLTRPLVLGHELAGVTDDGRRVALVNLSTTSSRSPIPNIASASAPMRSAARDADLWATSTDYQVSWFPKVVIF